MNFIGIEEEVRDHSKKRKGGGRPAINKKNKINLIFDPDARRRFLTGFRKRKQERKNKYQEKLEKELSEEKGRMREEAKKSIAKKQSSSHSILPEVQHLLEASSDSSSDEEISESYNFGSTTVHISSLEDSLCSVPLKIKKDDSDEQDSDEDIDEGKGFLKYKPLTKAQINYPTNSISIKEANALKLKKLKEVLKRPMQAAAAAKTETMVRKEANRLLQHSDAYKKALKYKQQHSRKFKLNRYQTGSRGGGGPDGGPAATTPASKTCKTSKTCGKSGSGSGSGGKQGKGSKGKNKKGSSVKPKSKSKGKTSK